jgi:hypothetical protein
MSVLYRRIDVLREGCFVLLSAAAGFMVAPVFGTYWSDDRQIDYLSFAGQLRSNS